MALVFLVVWRSLCRPWALLLAVGFFLIAAELTNVAFGHFLPSAGWSAMPSPFNAICILLAHGAISWGLIDYVEVPPKYAHPLRIATVILVAVFLLALAIGVLTRALVVIALCIFQIVWALLFVRAMQKEPASGHGLVMLAMVAVPGAMAWAAFAWQSEAEPSLSMLLPHALMGMPILGVTLLTTGLVRAHRKLANELRARVKAQADLEEVNQTLEQRVEMRTSQLTDTIAGLETFNRSISHDLRGPLGGIGGVAEIAREALGAGDIARVDEYLNVIVRQAIQSMDLVAALLLLARASDAQLERKEVKTVELVHEVVQSLSSISGAKGVVHIAPNLPDVFADEALLRQLVTNLVSNGIKFSALAEIPSVDVGWDPTPQGNVFFVRDNGVGFTAAQATELFRPFSRLHGARFEGNGVGLTIVRRIVERHGGKLWAKSSPDKGATFFFTLPAPPTSEQVQWHSS